jgi:hypothetical protein
MNTYEIKMITDGEARIRYVEAESKAQALTVANSKFSFTKILNIKISE